MIQKLKRALIATVLFLFVSIVFCYCRGVHITFDLQSQETFPLQVYYANDFAFSEANSVVTLCMPEESLHFVKIPVASNSFRFDFGNKAGITFALPKITISYFGLWHTVLKQPALGDFLVGNDLRMSKGSFVTTGNDAFTGFKVLKQNIRISKINILLFCLAYFFVILLTCFFPKARMLSAVSFVEEGIYSLRDYIIQNKNFLFYAFSCILIIWGFELFNFTISIDDEGNLFAKHLEYVWVEQGRWGNALISLLLPNTSIPVFSLFISLAGISVSFLYLLECVSASNRTKYILFPFFIATPLFYFTLTFSSLNPAIGISVLAATLATGIIMKYRTVPTFLFAVLLCAFSIGCYQSLIMFPPAVFLFILLGRYLREPISPKILFKHGGYLLSFLIASLLLYASIQKMLLFILNVKITYITYFIDLPNNFAETVQFFSLLLSKMKSLYLGQFGEQIHLQSLLLLISVCIIIGASWIRRHRWFDVLFYLFACGCLLLLPFGLDILLSKGASMPIRTMITLPFVISFLLVLALQSLPTHRKYSQFALAFLIVLVGVQYIALCNKMFYANQLQFRKDLVLIQSISERLKSIPELQIQFANRKKTPLVLVGTQNDHMDTPYPFLKKETIGRSIVSWAETSPVQNIALMKWIGVDYFVKPTASDYQKIANEAKNMGNWPMSSSVAYINGIAVVKFSDFSRTQVLVYDIGQQIKQRK